MKKHITLLLCLLLNSCNIINNSSVNSTSSSINSSVSNSTSTILSSSTSSNSSSISSSSHSSVNKNDNITRELHLLATNDFHGSIEENGSELGLLRYGTFFKNKRKEDNTLILNSGDMWQGSILSNSNRGEFLTKVMNNIGFDCFTLGNHEFDWSTKYIKQNKALYDIDTNYQTPFLCANLYNYDLKNNIVLDQASDIASSYTIKELENGLKVGIIGVIGEKQITSITSNYVDNYTFVNPTNVIKDLSNELKVNQNCDVVIVDAHTSFDQIDTSITDISPISNKRYTDAVFCAHSHQYEKYLINNVPFIQASCNGQSYGEINLSITNGEISLINYSSHENDVSEITSIKNYDEDLVSLYNQYNTQEIQDIANETLGNFNGYMTNSCSSTISFPNLVATAIAKEALNQGYNIDFSLVNKSRSSINKGDLTYSSLYKALPFDNEILVIEAKGNEIYNQANYNSVYNVNAISLDQNKTYKVAVLDYIALHRNVYRKYDYFSSHKLIGSLTNNNEIYNYRDITANYIRKNKKINYKDYSKSDSHYNV